MALVVAAAACSTSTAGAPGDEGATDASDARATEPGLSGCDPLDATACLLPFPNDAFTAPDDSAPTGRRLALPEEGLPTNADDVPAAPEDLQRSDGFSPGSALLVHVPGLDVDATGLAPSTDVGASLDDDAPVVLVDAETGDRVPYWAELDAASTDPSTTLLMVHPATALAEGHRHLVGLRDLRDAAGDPVAPSPTWQEVGDGTLRPEARRAHLAAVGSALDDAVGGEEDWWLAWDATVASAEGLAADLLHMQAEADAALDGGAPEFTVDEAVDAGPVRTVTGTYEVPSFLDDPDPGGRLARGGDGLPELTGTLTADFTCVVPTDPDDPALPIVYGHGLLGSASEVGSLAVAVPLGGLAACATDWIGMASVDIAEVGEVLADLSRFGTIPDRLRQAHVDTSVLGRLLNVDDGFASDPAFRTPDGTPVLDVGATQFVGNSQGGSSGGRRAR